MNRFFRWIAAALGALLLPACTSITNIDARHDPLYRAEAHTSTITVNASNKRHGINRIRINVVSGEMTACGGGLPSLIPCRTGAFRQIRTCTFSAARQASCDFALNMTDRRLVTYDVEVVDGKGSAAGTPTVTYAAGAPLTTARVGLGPFAVTIPWETARPIWWHTSAPSGSTPADRIDVGFFPDADWPSYRAFTDGVQPIILQAHFDKATPFSNSYSFWRGAMFNLWAGPTGADGEGCIRFFGGAAGIVAGATDAEAIVHRADFRDCAALSLGGSGTVQATAGDPGWLYVHESGHFILGLGDEYCCDGGYSSVSNPPNIFSSQSDCTATAGAIGIASSFCMQIGTTGKWRMDDGADSTMEDRTAASGWRTASGQVFGNRLSDCVSGNC